MVIKIKNYLYEVIILAIIFSVFAALWYVNAFSKSVLPERQFSVSGEGKVIAVPDIAEISLGVLTEGGKNLSDLQKENTGKTNRIISFLKEKGMDKKDIKTQFYNISPRYQSFPCPLRVSEVSVPCLPSEIVGYSISQTILAKVRDLDKIGEILSGAVEKGANTVSGPAFIIDDIDKVKNEARKEAISKAKEKAKTMAKTAGFRLGKLISINEGGNGFTPFALQRDFAKEGSAPSIEPGSQEVSVFVNLIYEIK